MADLIQNVQDVFKKWESKGAANFSSRGRRGHSRGMDRNSYGRSGEFSEPHLTYSRPGDRRFRQRDRTPFYKLPTYDSFAQFKMAPCVTTENKQRPFMGSCCSKCLPLSKASITDARVFSLSVCNILHIPHLQSLDFSVALNILKWKQRPAYFDVYANVLKSEGVRAAIQDVSDEYVDELNDCDEQERAKMNLEQCNRAKYLLEYMKASVSSLFLHISSLLLHSVLNRMFNAVLVHKGQLEILKTASQENIPIIFIPIHQNHFDHVLISFILFMNSLKVPLVATDQDLYIPIIRYLLKFLGAFFIRNHLKNKYRETDVVYSAVLQSYVTECLKAGHNLEIFLDKDFSFSNKLQVDKYNLLPIVIESISKGNVEDAYISTVSISHEKILGRDFVQEQLGQQKDEETFFTVIYSIWKMMHVKFGNVRLSFGQPFSIKEFLQSTKHNSSFQMPNTYTPPSSPTNDDSPSIISVQKDLENEQLHHASKNLVRHVIYDATFSTSLMSTHLLAFLLLTQYRKGATQQQLQNSMDWLRGQLLNKKRDAGFTGQSLPVIKHAVEVLGKDLISSEVIDMEWTSSDLENNNVKVTIYKPAIKLPHVLELQYYANYVVPVFLLDSILVNAIYALVDVEICHFRHCDSQLYVSREELIDKAVELSDLLQFEFIPIPPCEDISLVFSDTVDALVEKECIHVIGVSMIPGRTSRYTNKSHALCFDASDDEDGSVDSPVFKKQQLKVDLTEESINHLEFLRNVLSPYIESYWISACTLMKLIDEVKEESVFIQEMQLTAQEKLYKGLLAYEESFSAITFKNSLKLFESWHVIKSYEQDGMKIVYLSENYNNKEMVHCTIARIEQFRK